MPLSTPWSDGASRLRSPLEGYRIGLRLHEMGADDDFVVNCLGNSIPQVYRRYLRSVGKSWQPNSDLAGSLTFRIRIRTCTR